MQLKTRTILWLQNFSPKAFQVLFCPTWGWPYHTRDSGGLLNDAKVPPRSQPLHFWWLKPSVTSRANSRNQLGSCFPLLHCVYTNRNNIKYYDIYDIIIIYLYINYNYYIGIYCMTIRHTKAAFIQKKQFQCQVHKARRKIPRTKWPQIEKCT